MSFIDPAGRRPVALVDLGDTLADCYESLADRCDAIGIALDNLWVSCASLPDIVQSTCHQITKERGFWQSLRPRRQGIALMEAIVREGLAPRIVTKGPADAPHVWLEKASWCRRYFPDIPVTITTNKAGMDGDGDLLVDDWPPYVESWQRKRRSGMALIPAQHWNSNFGNNVTQFRVTTEDSTELRFLVRGLRESLRKSPALLA